MYATKKLNSPMFDEIKSGQTLDEISATNPIYASMLKTWSTKFGFIKDLLMDTERDILAYNSLVLDMCQYYENPSSLRMHIEALANILLYIDKNRHRLAADNLFDATKRLQKKIMIEKSGQLMSDRELNNYVEYDELCRIRDTYTIDDIRDHMIKLILALNTYYPPMRHEILNMRYVERPRAPNMEKTPLDNYLHKGATSGNYWFIINNDKVSAAYGPSINKIEDEVAEHSGRRFVFGVELKALLDESFKMAPRRYLLCSMTDVDEPMPVSTYNYLLKTATGRDVKQSLLRKIYVNWLYAIPNITQREKKRAAQLMRHSYDTQESSYHKLNL